jgi:hypothetical protein
MARHSEPVLQTVSSIRMIAAEAIHAAKEIESLCEMLDSENIRSIPVKFLDTATKGNTHLRSFARSIRQSIHEYHATGAGVTVKGGSDAAIIARASADPAAKKPKPKQKTNKKSVK